MVVIAEIEERPIDYNSPFEEPSNHIPKTNSWGFSEGTKWHEWHDSVLSYGRLFCVFFWGGSKPCHSCHVCQSIIALYAHGNTSCNQLARQIRSQSATGASDCADGETNDRSMRPFVDRGLFERGGGGYRHQVPFPCPAYSN